jgi:N-acetylmuramoyl-L-alanine amidase
MVGIRDGSRATKLFVIMIFWIFGSVWPSSVWALNKILSIRHWVAPDHTRVVIDTGDEVRFTVEKGERTIAVDLEDTAFPTHIPHLITLKKPGLESVTLLPRTRSGVRVELSVTDGAQTTVFKLKRIQDKPYRIVIDIVLPDVARQESEAREKVKITRKDRIVVIDPGHGGESVGAVGKGGTFEKDIVLAISRRLRDILNAQGGYRAFLTRDGDYYVSFKKRMRIAREYGAELFVSIHADAARNRAALGTSVYCLSTGGASNEAARILARNENLADVVGGVPNGEGGEASDPIILNMFQTHAINQSRTFGGGLLRHLGQVNRLKFPVVQEAPFVVLKHPDIPSVLVETAYISNAREETLLKGDGFQRRLAEAVSLSIVEFLPPLLPVVAAEEKKEEGKIPEKEKPTIGAEVGHPAAVSGAAVARHSQTPGKVLSSVPPVREKGSLYRVKKGDTLHRIAVSHGISVPALLQLNRMQPGAPLLADRLLKVPGKPLETPVKKPVSGDAKRSTGQKRGKIVYQVKRGDTLNAIARRHNTTVRALEQLNRLKPSEPLYVDRKLVIPGSPSL